MPNDDLQADPRDNDILACLPEDVYARLRPDLKQVKLELGQTLYRLGQKLHYTYFPLDTVVSKVYFSVNGDTTGIGLIGSDGMVGASSFLSGNETVAETLVVKNGIALRLNQHALAREFERGEAFQHALLGFTQAFMTQMGQKAVCHQHHSVDQQLCCWLLLYLDRSRSNKLRVTHELVARLIGVRREGITRAALKLKREGILTYHHGQITINDRERLRALACECYGVVTRAYENCCVLPVPVQQ